VIVVEHDEEAIRTADHLIDMGPGAGIHGGQIIAEGTPEEVMRNRPRASPGNISTGIEQIPDPAKRRAAARPLAQGRRRARQQSEERHGEIPLGTFTCVTGVSGGGKSTL
jgi:excinuclease ABC subunit A